MLELKKGIDIVVEIGGITSHEATMALFKEKLDEVNLAKIQRINHPEVLLKVANAITMCEPDTVFINTGSKEDRQHIRSMALKKGEEAPLPMPDHTIHFDLKEEQGRIVDRTFYIANEGEDISSLAKQLLRSEALEIVRDQMTGIMHGKTMMVGFYVRGPIGAPVSNPALEITSSTYVSHSAEILYRNAFNDFDKEVGRANHFFTNIHSEGLNRPEDLPDARVM
ncbi:MAG: phosphoenolpyruvate carboxykinase, partial [Deltaproteobacteria bacterium]|nr:phosphoenolpyruvate carboxykinase [Deltaproteobacteria bacterium]